MRPGKQELPPEAKTKIQWGDKVKRQWVAESGPESILLTADMEFLLRHDTTCGPWLGQNRRCLLKSPVWLICGIESTVACFIIVLLPLLFFSYFSFFFLWLKSLFLGFVLNKISMVKTFWNVDERIKRNWAEHVLALPVGPMRTRMWF